MLPPLLYCCDILVLPTPFTIFLVVVSCEQAGFQNYPFARYVMNEPFACSKGE
jgi:hypothetical protein